MLGEKNREKVLVAQSCPTLCDLMDYSPPGSSVHGILQARILEWVAMPFSRGSSLKDRTWVSSNEGRFFTVWATREETEKKKKKNLEMFKNVKKDSELLVNVHTLPYVLSFTALITSNTQTLKYVYLLTVSLH